MVNEKANLCFLEIDTSHGDICKVLDSQGKSREVFKRAQNEIGMFRNNSSGSQTNFINVEVSMEVGCENNSNKNSVLKKMRKLQKDNALGDDETELCREAILGNTIRFCCICKRPLEEDCSAECPGCNLDVSCNLEIAYQKNDVLSNRVLGQNVEPPTLNLIKNPERSRDPLSVVLLTNWENDDFYTPINLLNIDAHNADGNREEFFSQHPKKSELSNERMENLEDHNESSDGWFLSASGRLEFGPEETPRKKKEKDLKVYRNGPVTRSRSKRFSKSSERKQINKPKGRDERTTRYCRHVSPSMTEKNVARKAESSGTEVSHLEFVRPDELISTPMHAGGFSSVVRDIFSPKKSNVKTVTSSSQNDVAGSVRVTPHNDLSTYNDWLIDSTTKHHSSSTLQRTPKKKQKSREMGF